MSTHRRVSAQDRYSEFFTSCILKVSRCGTAHLNEVTEVLHLDFMSRKLKWVISTRPQAASRAKSRP